MQTTRVAYNQADSLLPIEAINEIDEMLARLPVPIWPGKSANNASLSIMQPMLNALLRELFEERGWHLEAPYSNANNYFADAYKVFGGCRVLVEAEFGNAARSGVDLLKFQGAHLVCQTMDVGVQLTVTKRTAAKMDRNTATFEDTQKLLAHVAHSYTTPLLLYGLEEDGSAHADIWNMGYSLASLKNGNNKRTKLLAREALGLQPAKAGTNRNIRVVPATATGQLYLL